MGDVLTDTIDIHCDFIVTVVGDGDMLPFVQRDGVFRRVRVADGTALVMELEEEAVFIEAEVGVDEPEGNRGFVDDSFDSFFPYLSIRISVRPVAISTPPVIYPA